LNSQYDIARALQAMGKHRDAMEMIAGTVEEARKAHLDAQLPALLREQSRMAEANGDLKLALAAEREAMQIASGYWKVSLGSQQAELAARYAAREKEIRIQELERNNQIKNLKLKAARADAERNTMQLRRQHGTLIAALIAAVSLIVGIVSLLLLMRSQWRHGRELRRQAQEDPLTGVDNRRGFFRRAQALLARRDADAAPLHALLLFDFDHFKRVNDQYGHPFGDIVLNVSMQCLRGVVDSRGRLARLGGEEFVVLCPRLGGSEALRLAEEMRAAIGALVFPDAPDNLDVTISVGMALFDGTRCHDAGSWLRAADDAMYAAKARGRDQVAYAQEVEQMLQQVGATPRTAS
jgi:diguanylate cyclase (GGDEF)-like protein